MKTILPAGAGVLRFLTLAVGAMLALAGYSRAATFLFYVDPVSQSVGVGGSGTFDLRVRIDPAAEPIALGDYDVSIAYDNSIVQIDSLTFGTEMGVSDNSLSTFGGGLIHLLEVSFELPGDLLALQPDGDFVLATVGFTGLTPGVSPLDVTTDRAGDQEGISQTAETRGGRIVVTATSTPEAMGVLPAGLAAGLILCLGGRFARKSRFDRRTV